MNNKPAYTLAIHGGAGTILRSAMTLEKEQSYRAALALALELGEKVLAHKGSALDAVEAAVQSLEDCPLFNAGRGAVFTSAGSNELDASIMCGWSKNAGAVAMVQGVKNPIRLARLVMEKSGHVLLAGQGAEEFARSQAVAFEDASYFHTQQRYDQWLEVRGTNTTQLDHSDPDSRKFGTVGAVALDVHGNLAAATSTGGMTNKRFGRVGDSPLIGCGTYASNATCAISCTGSGEYFIRGVVAYDVSCLMEYRGMVLIDAVREVIHNRLLKLGGDGGLIAADAQGNVALDFNTEGMYRASVRAGEGAHVAIYGNQ